MYSFLKSHREKVTHEESECFIFGPGKIVQAIVYHLLDQKLARIIDSESCSLATLALSNRLTDVAVSKDEWSVMENAQRLEWLLHHSRINFKLRLDGSAALTA